MQPQRMPTWSAYDAAFEEWQATALATGTCTVASVPLPPSGHAPVAPASTPEAWHVNVKKATLRWHPDKWSKFALMVADDTEREVLKNLTNAMFRAVTLHKDRGFRNARATTGAGVS